MPILNQIVDKAYNQLNRNFDAVAARGWNPLKRYLLDSPEINKMKEIVQIEEETNEISQALTANPSLLNTSNRKAADVMDTLIQHRMRHGRIEERARKLKESDDIKAFFDGAKAVTSGVMVSNGVYSLDKPELLQFLIQKKAHNQNEAISKTRKKRSDLLEKTNKVACSIKK